MMSNPAKRINGQGSLLGNVLSTGFTGGVCLAIGLYVGYSIDQHFHSDPWGIIGGILFGLAAAAVQTWKQLNESIRAFDRDQRRTD